MLVYEISCTLWCARYYFEHYFSTLFLYQTTKLTFVSPITNFDIATFFIFTIFIRFLYFATKRVPEYTGRTIYRFGHGSSIFLPGDAFYQKALSNIFCLYRTIFHQNESYSWVKYLCKVGYVFPMVIVSMLPYAEFERNGHREGTPHFIISNQVYESFLIEISNH